MVRIERIVSIAELEELVSADSHVIEPVAVWDGLLPPSFWPDGGAVYQGRPGGHDPVARIEEMAVDGVAREVLYPSLGLKLFAIDDAALQQRCCRAYNEWLAAYCATAPDKLIGVGMVAAYDSAVAVAEIEWCAANGLRGVMLWQTPPRQLPLASSHYEPVWAAAASAGLPMSFHILTGFDYSREVHDLGAGDDPLATYRNAVGNKLAATIECLGQLTLGGVLERHPDLQVVYVESEVGWLPHVLTQLDQYWERLRERIPLDITTHPSRYFERQCYATFVRDGVVGHLVDWWGVGNVMWSNDYPHRTSTWPESRSYLGRIFGDLPPDALDRVIRGTAESLYRVG